MREGCAGFFTDEALAAGKGIVKPALKAERSSATLPENWQELVPQARESYNETQVDALRHGDLAACFGSAFEAGIL